MSRIELETWQIHFFINMQIFKRQRQKDTHAKKNEIKLKDEKARRWTTRQTNKQAKKIYTEMPWKLHTSFSDLAAKNGNNLARHSESWNYCEIA